MRGGREFADSKYHALRFDDNPRTFGEAVKLIAARIINEQLSPRVEQEYSDRLAAGKVDLDYDRFHKDPIVFPDIFRTEQIIAYDDGVIKSVRKSTGNISLYQGWYNDGTPKIASYARTVEKRLWYRDNRPECLINYKEGILHGLLVRWADDKRIIFSATYDQGCMRKAFDRSCHHDFPSMIPVLERPPKGTPCGVRVGIILGEEDPQPPPSPYVLPEAAKTANHA